MLTKGIKVIQLEASCILFWTVIGSDFHSLLLQQGLKHIKSCSLPPCHHPPQTHPCHSHTAPSGCSCQTQNCGAGMQDYDPGDTRIGAYFIATLKTGKQHSAAQNKSIS